MGKSMLLLGLCIAPWCAGHVPLLANREMRPEVQARRFSAFLLNRIHQFAELSGDVAWRGDILHQLKMGELDDRQMAAFRELWEGVKVHSTPFFQTDPSSIRTISDVDRIVKQYRQEHGVEIVC